MPPFRAKGGFFSLTPSYNKPAHRHVSFAPTVGCRSLSRQHPVGGWRRTRCASVGSAPTQRGRGIGGIISLTSGVLFPLQNGARRLRGLSDLGCAHSAPAKKRPPAITCRAELRRCRAADVQSRASAPRHGLQLPISPPIFRLTP